MCSVCVILVHMYIYIYIYIYTFIYTYIYIYIERERERYTCIYYTLMLQAPLSFCLRVLLALSSATGGGGGSFALECWSRKHVLLETCTLRF